LYHCRFSHLAQKVLVYWYSFLEFVVDAAEKYGARGAAQAEDIIAGFSGLCAGGTLSEEDKDAVMKALQDIYWESKARNVQKYTPKKFE